MHVIVTIEDPGSNGTIVQRPSRNGVLRGTATAQEGDTSSTSTYKSDPLY